MADPNTMTFGVEIECAVSNAAFRREGWSQGGYRRQGDIPGFHGWSCTYDGSLHGFEGTMRPVEVVSPILRGAAGLAQVQRMAEKIRSMDGQVNLSCGFHVHVGFDRNDIASMLRLVYLTANVELGLFASTGTPSRVTNSMCRSIKRAFVGLTNGKAPETLSGIESKASQTCERYHALNLTNMLGCGHGHDTVEFRLFAGTLNGTKMVGYVQMCLGLVQTSLETSRRAKWVAAERPYVFTGGHGESELKRTFAVLGWTGTYGFKPRGVLDADSLPTVKKVLVKMARKFDGVAPRGAAVEVQ